MVHGEFDKKIHDYASSSKETCQTQKLQGVGLLATILAAETET